MLVLKSPDLRGVCPTLRVLEPPDVRVPKPLACWEVDRFDRSEKTHPRTSAKTGHTYSASIVLPFQYGL
jgi:hypothetical protein